MKSETKIILLIHGLWMTSKCWNYFRNFYETLGYTVVTPAWPGIHGGVQEMNFDSSSLNDLGVIEIVDHYEKIISSMEEQPIIMGHSFGALIAQILLDRGLGVAGVAIASAPLKGILTLPYESLRSSFPVLKNPRNLHRSVALTFDEFNYGFTNNMPIEQARRIYFEQAIPGPGRVLFQAAFANFIPHAATTVDYRNNERAPLLLVTGKEDHISPPAVSRRLYRLYHRSNALTDYKEFANRSHWIMGQTGWQEVAEYVLAWALTHTRPEKEEATSPSIYG